MVFLRAFFLIIFLGGITIGIQAQELKTSDTQAFSDKFFRLVLQEIHDSGPTTETAQFLARNIDLIWIHKEELLKVMAPYLSSTDELHCGAALKVISVMRSHSPIEIKLSWQFQTPEKRQPLQIQLDDLILSNLKRLLQLKNSESLHELARYLGIITLPEFKSTLYQLATNPEVSEQALISLTWHHDPADLDFLLPFMLQDKPGARLLPYALRNYYGDVATPYLKKVLKLPFLTFTQVEAAKELIHAGQKEGIWFFIKVLSQNPIQTKCQGCQFITEVGQFANSYLGYKGSISNRKAIVRFLLNKAKSSQKS